MAGRPAERWTASTRASVFGPKLPSTASPPMAACSTRTVDPPDPRRSVVPLYFVSSVEVTEDDEPAEDEDPPEDDAPDEEEPFGADPPASTFQSLASTTPSTARPLALLPRLDPGERLGPEGAVDRQAADLLLHGP